MRLWSKNISELLEKLRQTVPADGMIGEIQYWRNMARILTGINEEIRQQFVETSMQLLLTKPDFAATVENFAKEKN